MKQGVLELWRPIARRLKREFKNKDRTIDDNIKLFRQILSSLPETILVDEDCLSEGSVISGISNLYSRQETYLLKAKDKQEIAFDFHLNKATVYRRWFGRKILFQGSWVKCLEYVISRIAAVPSARELISNRQREAIIKLISELKKD